MKMTDSRYKPLQIKNLKIRYSKLYEKWHVVSPRGAVLEEFRHKADAIKCARELKDFVRRK